MIVQDQSETIAFLERPRTHGSSGPVGREETHISEVFLAGNFPQSPCDLHGGPLHDFGSLNKGFEALDDDDEF